MFKRLKNGAKSIKKGLKKMIGWDKNKKPESEMPKRSSGKYADLLTTENKKTLQEYPMIRKAQLQQISNEDILKYFEGVYPPEAKDENVSEDKRKKLGSHMKNTGIYLWKKGYNPEKLLGIGANGVVWRCKESESKRCKAVKVTCDGSTFGIFPVKAVAAEKHDVELLKGLIDDRKDADRYLFAPEYKKDDKEEEDRAIFESALADKGDLEHYKSGKKEYEKFLFILKTAINVLKALEILHDKGYSHNDVKPDNLFVITSSNARSAANEADKIPEDEEVDVKLADFGAMTRTDASIFDQKLFANRYFYAPDMRNLHKEAVDKRDVYSLGAVLVFMFVGCTLQQAKAMAKKLETSKDLNRFCDDKMIKSSLGRSLLFYYDPGCNPDRSKKILAFLNILRWMVASSYKKRCTVKEALTEMEKVSAMSDRAEAPKKSDRAEAPKKAVMRPMGNRRRAVSQAVRVNHSVDW